MGKNYDIDINTINIESWNKFVEKNEQIKADLNTCCSNVADIIANSETINTMIPEIETGLSGLKKVTIGSVPQSDLVLSAIQNINAGFKEQSLIILGGISYAELKAKSFDGNVDPQATSFFKNLLEGVADSNVYWLLNSILENTQFNALGFCLAYGTDLKYEGGHFVVGDGAVKLFQAGASKFWKIDKLPAWVNLTVGTAAVFGVTAFIDYKQNKGEWTPEDKKRLLADSLTSALGYAEWVAIYGGVSAMLEGVTLGGFAVGGPVGAVVAGLIAIPTSFLFKDVVDVISGDNIVYTFKDSEGKTYEVPRNGLGKHGEFSAMVDIMNDSMERHEYGGRVLSDTTFNDLLYNDYRTLFELDTGKTPEEYYYYTDGYDELMAEVDKIEDPWEAYVYYCEHSTNNDVAYFLSLNYGFDIVKYLETKRGFDWDEYVESLGGD